MSRRPSQTFACKALEDLTHQLLFAPPEKRLEQVRRAEQLHDQIEPQRNYPWEYLQYRITGYRGESPEPTLLTGQAVLPDLRLLIDSLSRSVGLPADDEPAESPEDLAARLHVTTRTIARWRHLGLRWRWVATGPDKPPRLMIARAAAERFLNDHAARVERAGRFTRIKPAARQRIIDRARRLVLARDLSLNQVAAHLARRTHRALETIRQVLERHDKLHPRQAVFADRSGPLNARQKRIITRAHERGISIARIARRFNKTHSTIYRAIRQRRAADLLKLDVPFVPSPLFTHDDADAMILTPLPQERPDENPADNPRRADDLPSPVDRLYLQPSLPPAVERSLFVRFNYLKFKAAHTRQSLDRYEPRVADMDQMTDLLRQAAQIRNQLVAANLARVASVARRHLTDQTDASRAHLLGLLALGNRSLIEAVEQFDPGRGQPFESFLTFSLQRSFVQAPPTARAHRRPDGQAILRGLLDDAKAHGVELIAGNLLLPEKDAAKPAVYQ